MIIIDSPLQIKLGYTMFNFPNRYNIRGISQIKQVAINVNMNDCTEIFSNKDIISKVNIPTIQTHGKTKLIDQPFQFEA